MRRFDGTCGFTILLMVSTLPQVGAQVLAVTDSPGFLSLTPPDDIRNVTCTTGCDVRNGNLPAPAAPPKKVDYSSWIIGSAIVIIGLIGNTLTIVIMRRKAFRQMTMSLILIVLSISDTTIIAMQPFNKAAVLQAVGWDVRAISLIHCKVFFFIWRVAKMTSSWFVVLISFERVVAVALPFHAKKINSRRNVLALIAAVYLFIGTFDLIWGFFADIVVNGFCQANKGSLDPSVERGLVVAGTMIYSVIPASLIFVINGITISHIALNVRRRQQMTSEDTDDGKTSKTNAMLISLAVAFLILVTPVSIAHTYTVISGINFFRSRDPSVATLREIVQTLEQLNYGTNFFMYVIFSEAYRRELAAITGLSCIAVQKKRKPTETPTSRSK